MSSRVFWSVWMQERSSSGTVALSSRLRKEATSKPDHGHLRLLPSTLKQVFPTHFPPLYKPVHPVLELTHKLNV